MATDDSYERLLAYSDHRRFTLTEACDYMKELDKYATPLSGHPINWMNAKTGSPVSIGYT